MAEEFQIGVSQPNLIVPAFKKFPGVAIYHSFTQSMLEIPNNPSPETTRRSSRQKERLSEQQQDRSNNASSPMKNDECSHKYYRTVLVPLFITSTTTTCTSSKLDRSSRHPRKLHNYVDLH